MVKRTVTSDNFAANSSSNLLDSKTWTPVKIAKGTVITVGAAIFVGGIIWYPIAAGAVGTLYITSLVYKAFTKRHRNYLASALSEKYQDIEKYLRTLDSADAESYLSLVDQASIYLKEAREFAKEELVTGSDISESFKEILGLVPETLDYKLQTGHSFFSEYDSLKQKIEPGFKEYIKNLLNNSNMDNCKQLEKIMLGVYDFARKVYMNGPGYHGVNDGSIEIYMKLKKMHES